MKTIAYFSGTRADFGLMSPVLKALKNSSEFKLSLYATGVHLMPEFGKTIQHVKKEFPSVKSIDATFKSDDKDGMAGFIGEYSKLFHEVVRKDRPDLILILGDRVEMLCTAQIALYLGIPTAHFHGGERTSTVDETVRHAITKLSSIHFAATLDSAKRIQRMGEKESRIHIVGAPALETILNEKLPSREELFLKLGIDPGESIILLAQHPVTEQIEDAGKQIAETIRAVKKFKMHTVVVYPHPDPGGRRIIKEYEKEKHNPYFHFFPSFEFKDFLGLQKYASVLVGNSSAGMIESSSFHLPVVNIGERQLNRVRGKNVIDVVYDTGEIEKAIRKSLFDKNYGKSLRKLRNPWGDGNTSKKVLQILKDLNLKDPKMINKRIAY